MHLVEGLLLLGLGGLVRAFWKRYDDADARSQQNNAETRQAVEKEARETREAVRDVAGRIVQMVEKLNTHATTLALHERELAEVKSEVSRLRGLHDAVMEKLQGLEREFWRKGPT